MTEDANRRNQDSLENCESVEQRPPEETPSDMISSEDAYADVSDLEESSGETIASASSFEMTSDALYIVREHNYLLELNDALEAAGIEMKEEVE